ncbi:MAG: site-specific integrase [Acidobacteria bacterium]|nr:site-specific integrase [Acidobacteriota bacterium]
MATIEERSNDDGSVAYRVKIRLKGRRQVSETFQRKTDARIWAQRTESELRRGRLLGLRRTVGEAIDHYLQHELALLAQSEKRHRIRHLGWWRDRLGSQLLEEIGPADAREALRALEGRKVATVNRYRAALSAVLSVAVEEEWIASHPLHRARRRKRPNAEREVERDREVTREEMEALKAACRLSEDSRLYALVVFAYASGAREGELMRMEWSRAELSPTILDPVTRETRPGVPRVEVVATKNGSSRMLYFPGEAGELLRDLRPRTLSRYIFASQGLPPEQVPSFPTQAWRYWRRKAELSDLRFHDLRHSWACNLLDSGATLAQLMILGGWKSANMVRRYAARAQRHGSDAVEVMHRRGLV